MIAFVFGGFAMLLPLQFLYLAGHRHHSSHATAFNHIFMKASNILMSIGALPGAFITAFAHLFWPDAKWRKAFAALVKPKHPLIDWPQHVMASGLGVSIEATNAKGKARWLGSEKTTAQVNPAHLSDALIVTLIAFSLINGFLALLIFAYWIG